MKGDSHKTPVDLTGHTSTSHKSKAAMNIRFALSAEGMIASMPRGKTVMIMGV